MRTMYVGDLRAHLTLDDDDRVRQIRHSEELWLSEQAIAEEVAAEYLRAVSDTYKIPPSQLSALHRRVSYFDPRAQGVEYQLSEEKRLFDSVTLGYYQTFMNVPVWRRGLSVTLKEGPNRVVGSVNNSEDDLKGELPAEALIERYREMFRTIEARKALVREGLEDKAPVVTSAAVRNLLKLPGQAAAGGRGTRKTATRTPSVLSGRFFIYKYDPDRRFAGKPLPPESRGTSLEEQPAPIPRLPAVPDRVKPGRAYLVAEIIYEEQTAFGGMVWLILVEIETGAILYIEPQTCGVNGLVFARDPIVSTGNLALTSNSSSATLNPERDDVLLNNLDAPAGGVQRLRGTFVNITEQDTPTVAAPTTGGGDFDYDARTNNFAAVNAYYHETELFRTIADLGFPVATYFNGTTFPIPVDHRGMGTLGNTINAHWSPNGAGGTGHMCYALCDTTDTGNPLGRAVDPWVHWHEMGGHGTLGDHVGSGSLGFAHSAGDGLAAIQNDPESGLRGVAERFRYAPFRPFTNERRFDRPVPAWAWGSANDDADYNSEQILATCHFRIYRSIGGDSTDVGRRRFASRAATYLILRTIAAFTPATNPNNAQVWCEQARATAATPRVGCSSASTSGVRTSSRCASRR